MGARPAPTNSNIYIYNTLTRKKEVFSPIDPSHIKMYVCGITAYDSCHLGHARAYVTFDTIRRYLEFKNYSVLYIQNFTDVDDKIVKRANDENTTIDVISQRYTAEYFEVMDKLNVRRASIYPRATLHIDDMITIIKGLIEKGVAYVADGDVFFETEKFSEYGKLSKRNVKEMQTESRIGIDEKKKNPLDFALWKKAKPEEPFWESPWGKGRPGWHIECSAMSMKFLGTTLDIHGGGNDLIFPHHENEIAQSEAYSGKQFVNFWLHNGFVTMEEEKMSKSLGNVLLVKELFKKYSPQVLRFFLLSAHYRMPISFSPDKMQDSKNALERISILLGKIEDFLQQSQNTEHRAQNTEHRTQSIEHRAQNTEHRTQNTEHRAQNTEHRAQNTEHRAQNTEHRAQSTEHRTQNTEHRAQNTEHRCSGQSTIDNDNQQSQLRINTVNALQNSQSTIDNPQLAVGNNQLLITKITELQNKISPALNSFCNAMNDDFNVPSGIAVVFDLVKDTNIFLKEIENIKLNDKEEQQQIVTVLNNVKLVLSVLLKDVLGIDIFSDNTGSSYETRTNGKIILTSLIELLITLRNEAREKKEWALSDFIRDKLGEIGIILEDTPTETKWRQKCE